MDAQEAAALSKEFKDKEQRLATASQLPPITDYFIERHIVPEIDRQILERATKGEDYVFVKNSIVHWPLPNETKIHLIKHFEAKGFKCKVYFSPEEFYPETGWMPATETLSISWNS